MTRTGGAMNSENDKIKFINFVHLKKFNSKYSNYNIHVIFIIIQ